MAVDNEYLLNEIKTFGGRPANCTLNDKAFDVTGYTTAIKRATRDLTARTLTPKNQVDGTLIDALLSEENSDSFLNQIIRFFTDGPKEETEFDEWHHKRCQDVLDTIQTYYTNQNGTEVCYGKAQKIVNMTMKGCYCLSGATDREEYFRHGHMALDSFTLAWYNRNASTKVKTPWSNLDETEYKDIQYRNEDCSIRSIAPAIEEMRALTPLQKEFLIWPLEIMISTVKEINKCHGGMVDAPYVQAYFDQCKMGNDLIMANLILGRYSPEYLEDSYITWLKDGIPGNQTGKRAAAEFILEKYGIT